MDSILSGSIRMNLRSQQYIISSIFKHLLLGVLLLGVINCHCNSAILPTESDHTPPEDNRPTGGIENLGATCYMNSMLQILQAFYEPSISNLNDTAGPLVAPLKKAIHTMKVERRTVTSEESRIVFEALGEQFGWTTNESEQCDASDLLHLIWDWMGGPLLNTENTFIQHCPGNKQIEIESKAEDACIHYVALPSNGEACSMQQLFDNSLVPEQLEEYKDNGITIDNVYKHKHLELNEEILPLQLNRFDTNGGLIKLPDGSRKTETFEKFKRQDRVKNPMSLKISQEQTTDSKDRYYTLVGFIWHTGSIDGGHYKAYVKQKGTWVCYNDSAVTKITDEEAEAHAQEGYLFFYQPNQPAGRS